MKIFAILALPALSVAAALPDLSAEDHLILSRTLPALGLDLACANLCLDGVTFCVPTNPADLSTFVRWYATSSFSSYISETVHTSLHVIGFSCRQISLKIILVHPADRLMSSPVKVVVCAMKCAAGGSQQTVADIPLPVKGPAVGPIVELNVGRS